MAAPSIEYIMRVYLTEEEAIRGSKTTLISTMNQDTDLITTASPHGLVVGDFVAFKGTSVGSSVIGNLSKGTLYHVVTVPSVVTFTVSTTKGGAPHDFDATYTITGFDAFVVRDNALQV